MPIPTLRTPTSGRSPDAIGTWAEASRKAEELGDAVQEWLAYPGAGFAGCGNVALELVMPPKIAPSMMFWHGRLYSIKRSSAGGGNDVIDLVKDNPSSGKRSMLLR